MAVSNSVRPGSGAVAKGRPRNQRSAFGPQPAGRAGGARRFPSRGAAVQLLVRRGALDDDEGVPGQRVMDEDVAWPVGAVGRAVAGLQLL